MYTRHVPKAAAAARWSWSSRLIVSAPRRSERPRSEPSTRRRGIYAWRLRRDTGGLGSPPSRIACKALLPMRGCGLFLGDVGFNLLPVGVIVCQSCVHLSESQMRVFKSNFLRGTCPSCTSPPLAVRSLPSRQPWAGRHVRPDPDRSAYRFPRPMPWLQFTAVVRYR
jgi:hypothetical protein